MCGSTGVVEVRVCGSTGVVTLLHNERAETTWNLEYGGLGLLQVLPGELCEKLPTTIGRVSCGNPQTRVSHVVGQGSDMGDGCQTPPPLGSTPDRCLLPLESFLPRLTLWTNPDSTCAAASAGWGAELAGAAVPCQPLRLQIQRLAI